MHYRDVFHTLIPSEEMHQAIAQMPKVELHVHLEGATSAEAIFDMATRNGVKLPAKSAAEWKALNEFTDFNHFIQIYLLTVACMQTPLDFSDMVVDFMRRQASQNIQYSEVFFSATLHLNKLPQSEILAALQDGIRAGQEKYGVSIKLIPDISRDNSQEYSRQKEVLSFCLQAKEMGIGIGMGIGGIEIGYPSPLFKDIFAEARRQGLHVLAHSGETGAPASIWETITNLQPERIGHGIRSIEDPALVKELVQRQIPLEISPQSNYCTRVTPLDQPHPIRKLLDAGVICTVNSDDPCMFSTDLNNEYLTLAAQGFTLDELHQLNMNALRVSFLEPTHKKKLLQKMEKDFPCL